MRRTKENRVKREERETTIDMSEVNDETYIERLDRMMSLMSTMVSKMNVPGGSPDKKRLEPSIVYKNKRIALAKALKKTTPTNSSMRNAYNKLINKWKIEEKADEKLFNWMQAAENSIVEMNEGTRREAQQIMNVMKLKLIETNQLRDRSSDGAYDVHAIMDIVMITRQSSSDKAKSPRPCKDPTM